MWSYYNGTVPVQIYSFMLTEVVLNEVLAHNRIAQLLEDDIYRMNLLGQEPALSCKEY